MSEQDYVFPALQIARSTKAYGIRGSIPEDLGPEAVRYLGRAFAEALSAARPRVVVGRDMRESGVALSEAFIYGIRQSEAEVIDIGLCSTDELYFASVVLDAWGVMFTASHNPANYNGMKLCRPGATPISVESGLGQLRDEAIALFQQRVPELEIGGSIERRDMLSAYGQALRDRVDLSGIRRLKVVVDAGNGIAGLTVPGVLGSAAGLPALPLEIIEINGELDGTFPAHEANPIDPKNTEELQHRVVAEGADLGLAFDGDADRCFVIDKQGHRVSPSALTTLIGLREAEKSGEDYPLVLHNVITSRSVAEILTEFGISTHRTRVGHFFYKKRNVQEKCSVWWRT
ncbi:phosphohexomutase domain-containing protein [Scrofimicrobium canadense]|uniref:hypothetical protein n=1 Tax=Scrofimicrobium canadense TaxID=2652290 RepID=UPI001CED35C5|nr:hypothetical protein [Scrofimicrobium canadense]